VRPKVSLPAEAARKGVRAGAQLGERALII
jgi:hypothetical protein